MANLSAAIRKALPLFAFLWCSLASALDVSQRYNHRGSTRGLLLANPDWSLGVQAGNYGATGFNAQHVGLGEGALNIGLGLAHGSATLSADYNILFNSNFHHKSLNGSNGYNTFRGELNPYIGAGVQIGRGLSIRIPIGLQYTMLRDPFNFFGGGALLYGRFFTDNKKGLEAWFVIGARVLL